MDPRIGIQVNSQDMLHVIANRQESEWTVTQKKQKQPTTYWNGSKGN